jgi:hypothetical protein
MIMGLDKRLLKDAPDRLTKRQMAKDCVEIFVNGIPCLAYVRRFEYFRPDFRADNPFDYFGGYEVEYDLYDRKGYKAGWLEKIVDSKDLESETRDQIIEQKEWFNEKDIG